MTKLRREPVYVETFRERARSPVVLATAALGFVSGLSGALAGLYLVWWGVLWGAQAALFLFLVAALLIRNQTHADHALIMIGGIAVFMVVIALVLRAVL